MVDLGVVLEVEFLVVFVVEVEVVKVVVVLQNCGVVVIIFVVDMVVGNLDAGWSQSNQLVKF